MKQEDWPLFTPEKLETIPMSQFVRFPFYASGRLVLMHVSAVVHDSITVSICPTEETWEQADAD